MTGCSVFFVCLLFFFFAGFVIYNSIFRLSTEQVTDSLVGRVSSCEKINECELLPGDILVRRYMTQRNWYFEKLLRPYFTHVAFYLGDNYLVEATGKEKDPQDEIKIVSFSDSDWLNSSIENFVVIRPKNYLGKLDVIKKKLINIAEDPNYSFGFPEEGEKKTTCVDFIFQQLIDNNLLNIPSDIPEKITPDYLYWTTQKNKNNFDIIKSK